MGQNWKLLFKKIKKKFIWLYQVLVAAHGIFDLLYHAGSLVEACELFLVAACWIQFPDQG